MRVINAIILVLFALFLVSCGDAPSNGVSQNNVPADPDNHKTQPTVDDAIVKSSATITISAGNEAALIRKLKSLLMSTAYAASQTATVTVTNTPSTTMTINTAGLVAPPISDINLNFGNIVVSSLQDNNLKLCGVGGNVKCTHAAIRMYTTGSIAGFFNVVDNYAQPVSVTYNAATSVLGLVGAPVYLQTITIAGNRNTVKLTDFTAIAPQSYAISSDFNDAGVGNFSVSIVIEFVLQT